MIVFTAERVRNYLLTYKVFGKLGGLTMFRAELEIIKRKRFKT